jgi:hypothetical protein
MPGFETTPLAIPPLWEHDWAGLVDESDGVEKEIIRTQRYLVQSLSQMVSLPSSPETLGWLILWSRLFNICDSIRNAVERKTTFTLHLNSRALFELRLHLITILTTSSDTTRSDPASGESTLERMQAYTALCLFEDAEHYRAFLEERTLARIYDPEPTRRFIKQLAQNRERWESIAGPLEELSDQEAEFDREEARKSAQSRLNWFEECLNDTRLRRWAELIRTRRKPITFFSLLRENEGSVKKRLRSLGTEHGYLEYGKSSRIIHGSTAEHFSVLSGVVIMPIIGDADEGFDELIERLSWDLRGALITLTFIQKRLFEAKLSESQG